MPNRRRSSRRLKGQIMISFLGSETALDLSAYCHSACSLLETIFSCMRVFSFFAFYLFCRLISPSDCTTWTSESDVSSERAPSTSITSRAKSSSITSSTSSRPRTRITHRVPVCSDPTLLASLHPSPQPLDHPPNSPPSPPSVKVRKIN